MTDVLVLAAINAVVFFIGYVIGRRRGERIGRMWAEPDWHPDGR